MWLLPAPRTRSHRLTSVIAVTITSVLLAGGLLLGDPGTVSPVRAVVPIATTTTLDPIPAVQHGAFDLTAHVSPAPQPANGFTPAVSFTLDGAFWIPAPISADGDAVAPDVVPPPGSHQIAATWAGNDDYAASASAPQIVEFRVATATTLASNLNPATSAQAVELTAFVTNTSAGVLDGGTLSIVDTTTSTTLGTTPVGPTPTTLVISITFAVGTHILRAEYSGTGPVEASHSADLALSVVKDGGVDAGWFGVTPATFYPAKDGYKDELTIFGNTNEPTDVTISISLESTGVRYRKVSLGGLAGDYSWKWDGRKADGSKAPAGKYRVVQTLVDGAGNRLVSKLHAVLSSKRIVWKTETKSHTGDQHVIHGTGGTGWIRSRSSSYTGGTRISSGTGWAALGYSFASPAGTLYRNVTFQFLGRSPNGSLAVIAIWAPSAGDYHDTDSYDDAEVIGPTYGWWSGTAPLKSHRAGGKIRVMILVANDGSLKTFDIAKVRVTYTYGVLR
jgi:FlgD Ig-like domain